MNASALDAALDMAARQSEQDAAARDEARRRYEEDNETTTTVIPETNRDARNGKTGRIAILNVASHNTRNKVLGGLWEKGSVATEEEDLCLRTTLPLSFHSPPKGHRVPELSGFKLSRRDALYTPHVQVVRAN
ncbi:hypothetical protein SCUCBS95973_002092 [Sporothrix curviconia]|uniref:Microbial-type PARG catalytic domain-containing protein n=1 Tax=Sporothrix curviconia TaxID=1260050 RepID=A0ABP0B484_9PEZI